MLDAHNHGFENIDVPAIRDSEPDYVVRLGQHPAAKWNSQVPCYYSKHHRLPHPSCVAAFHSPLLRKLLATIESLKLGFGLANGTGGYLW